MERRNDLAVGGLVLGLCLAIYGGTACRTVSPVGDAGEMATAAITLGIPHAPGYPLFVLLGHLASLFPLGEPAARVNLAAALFGALAVLCVYWGLLENGIGRWAAGGAALALAGSSTLWQMSVSAEVRTLYLALAACLFAVLLRWRRSDSGEARRLSLLVALLCGLGVTAHYNFVVLACLALGVLMTNRSSVSALAPLAFLAGLLPFAWMSSRAGWDPYLNSGNPSTWAGLVEVLSRQGYGGLTRVSAPTAGEGTAEALKSLALAGTTEFTLYLLPLIVLGIGLAWKRRPAVCGWLLATAILLGPVYVAVVRPLATPDFWAVLQRQFLVLWMVCAWFLAESLQWLSERRLGPAVALLALLPLTLNLGTADLHAQRLGQAYGTDLLTPLAPNAVLMVTSDPATSLTEYQQGVMHLRPDVLVIPTGLIESTWFQAQLTRRYGGDFAGFDWRTVVQAHAPDPLVDFLLKKRPVYVENPWPSIDDKLMEEGIVYQVAATPEELVHLDPQLYLRQLNQQVQAAQVAAALPPGHADSSNMAFIRYIVDQYALAYTNLGVSMGRRGWDQDAKKALASALELSPHLAVAHFNLGFIAFSRDDYEVARQEFEAAVKDDPHYKQAYLALAEVYAHTGKVQEALQAKAQAQDAK